MPKTKSIQDFITSKWNKHWGPWIGVDDHLHEGSFVFVDGSYVTQSFYKSGQPDDHNGNEHCAHISDGYWNDGICGKQLEFVCQKGIDITHLPRTIFDYQ